MRAPSRQAAGARAAASRRRRAATAHRNYGCPSRRRGGAPGLAAIHSSISADKPRVVDLLQIFHVMQVHAPELVARRERGRGPIDAIAHAMRAAEEGEDVAVNHPRCAARTTAAAGSPPAAAPTRGACAPMRSRSARFSVSASAAQRPLRRNVAREGEAAARALQEARHAVRQRALCRAAAASAGRPPRRDLLKQRQEARRDLGAVEVLVGIGAPGPAIGLAKRGIIGELAHRGGEFFGAFRRDRDAPRRPPPAPPWPRPRRRG